MPAIDSTSELRTPWWIRPISIFVCLNLSMAFIALVLDDDSYAVWGTAKYFNLQYFGIVVIAAVAYGIGNSLGAITKVPAWRERGFLNLAFKISATAAIIAYPIWFANGVRNGFSPDMLWALLQGEAGMSDEIKETFETIPGITTMVQFAVTVACLYPFLPSKSRLEKWMLAILFGLIFIRSVVLSERLAIIEFLIPLLVAFAVRRYTRASPAIQKRIDFLEPLALGVSLVLLFAFTEYFRSWQFRQNEYSSFWQFVLSRFSAYYVTALNNGALLTEQIGLLPFPFFSALFFWYFPWLPDSLRYPSLFHRDPEVEFNEALRVYSTDEFNNGCGIFLTYVDFGIFGFIIHWVIMAMAARILLRDYCRGSLVGQLFFPLFLIAIVESPRVLYITNTRAFPAVVAAFAILFASRLKSK
jgi:oligosaccharide repeat unit polymerase